MIWYGKFAETGVAAASYLAQNFVDDRWISSEEIAQGRKLSKPLIAKVLTMLAARKLVIGLRGPNGGYKLARAPQGVSLFEVVNVFEVANDHLCPFGAGWCGTGEKCPLHDMIFEERERSICKMKETSLAVFMKA